MTLLEMIKKYTKKDTTKEHIWASQVVEDLKNVEDRPSVNTIRDEILEKVSAAVDKGNLNDALTLAHTLSMLPK